MTTSDAEAVERDARVRQHMAYRFARANVTYKMEGEPSAKDLDDFFNTSIDILIGRANDMRGVALRRNDFNVDAHWDSNVEWLLKQKST